MTTRGLVCLLVAVLTAHAPARAQPTGVAEAARDGPTRAAPQPETFVQRSRPVVGLVLSGGGARGFAHVGVLRALHDLRIPVDVIAGTSMGAVVGGLYASGIPLSTLSRLFREQDWTAIFDDDPPRPRLRVRRKREERNLLLPLEVGLDREGLHVPSGFLSGAKLFTLLQINTLHVRSVSDFSRFPIPFQTVATDVGSGEAVVLSEGSLATAMRASLSIPGVFSPVARDGRELVDGGLVNNLPVDLARALGADVVIAVDVGRGIEEAEGESAIEIANRSLRILMRRATEEQIASLGERDVLARPDLGDMGAADFGADELVAAIRAGRSAMREVGRRLGHLSVDAPAFQAWDEGRTAGWEPDPELCLAALHVDTTVTKLSPAVIEGAFSFQPGRTLTRSALERQLERVLGYGGFASVEFELLEPDEGNCLEIRLRARDKPWGPGILRAGLSASDRRRGTARWGFRVNWTRSRLNARGGELRTELLVGSDQRARIELYQPIDAGERWFAGATLEASQRDDRIRRETGGTESLDVTDLGVTPFVGSRFGAWGEGRLGLFRGRFDLDRASESDVDLPDASDEASWLAQLEIDALDRVVFPSKGVLLIAELRLARSFLGGDTDFERLGVEALGAISRGPHTLLVGGLLGSALGGQLPIAREFRLGGLFRLSGAEPGSVRGSYAGLGRLAYLFRLGAPARQAGGAPFRLGAALEAGQAWDAVEEIDLDALVYSISILAGLDTLLGPVSVGWSWMTDRSPGWFLQLGPAL